MSRLFSITLLILRQFFLHFVQLRLDVYKRQVIAFAFNEGAYCAETMRGALESVPQGQLEAGSCVGMTWWQIMRLSLIPI